MPFKKGVSGNPNGRPKGQETRAVRLRKAIEARAGELLETAFSLALAGDPTVLKFLLDKVIPNLRPVDTPQPLAIVPGDPLTAQGQQILQTMSRGEVSISDGSLLLAALANQSRLEESTELRERVAALESLNNVSPPL